MCFNLQSTSGRPEGLEKYALKTIGWVPSPGRLLLLSRSTDFRSIKGYKKTDSNIKKKP